MFLVRLVYASSITEGFNEEEIKKILETARKTNQDLQVTGMLCFAQKYFLQCLEGGRTNVNEIYHKILNDSRHNNIVLLDYKEIVQREFSEWTMGYIPESKLTRPLNLLFSPTADFNPYHMSGESCHQLMLSLKETIPTV